MRTDQLVLEAPKKVYPESPLLCIMSSMELLTIDTSDDNSFVAYGDTLILLYEKQSKTLLPTIKKLLPHPPTHIAIGIGPGSFTGTRVGVMAAKTLAYAWQIPLIPFHSLAKYAPDTNTFTIYGDAKSRGTFCYTEANTTTLLDEKKPITNTTPRVPYKLIQKTDPVDPLHLTPLYL